MQTTKETLAKAEFWAMQAMKEYSGGRSDALRLAHSLIKRVAEEEEEEAYKRALKAAQIA